jgi:hypothetical protein
VGEVFAVLWMGFKARKKVLHTTAPLHFCKHCGIINSEQVGHHCYREGVTWAGKIAVAITIVFTVIDRVDRPPFLRLKPPALAYSTLFLPSRISTPRTLMQQWCRAEKYDRPELLGLSEHEE